jgi:hypothetical protein
MNLIEQIDAINSQVRERFTALLPSQLNWKPEPSKWSIGQCLDHLIVSNTAYFSTFEQLIYHRYRLSFFQSLNPFKKIMGRLMVKNLGPEPKRKFTAPKILQPSASNIPSTIVEDFSSHQDELKNYFRKLLQLDTKHLYMASPVTSLVVYNLSSAMELITAHEQRHVNQAKNVLNHPNFPK